MFYILTRMLEVEVAISNYTINRKKRLFLIVK